MGPPDTLCPHSRRCGVKGKEGVLSPWREWKNEICSYLGKTIQIRGKSKHKKSLRQELAWNILRKLCAICGWTEWARGRAVIREAVGGWGAGQVGPYGRLWLFLGLRWEPLGFLGRGVTYILKSFLGMLCKEYRSQRWRQEVARSLGINELSSNGSLDSGSILKVAPTGFEKTRSGVWEETWSWGHVWSYDLSYGTDGVSGHWSC